MTAGAPSLTHVSPLSRIYGLGSVFAKTLRDSRRATLIVGAAIGLLIVVVAYGVTTEFGTAAAREQIKGIVESVPPIMQGLAGKPVNVDTLGGYVQYKYGGFFPLITGLWSILALAGTLAGETRGGSLDFVAASPISRRRIALEKVLGHVSMLAVAMLFIGAATTIAGSAFATLSGDEIPIAAAFGYAAWLGLMALAAGSVAFALGPFVGRGSAAGLAGAVMLGGFLLNGYQTAIPELAPFANLTWFGWTDDHIPLAGRFDWPSLGIVAVAALAFLAVGVEAFARRDLGVTSAIPGPRLPRALLGLGGPVGRSASERLATSLGWGIGLGLFGLLIAASGGSFIDQIAKSPDFTRAVSSIFPGIDFGTIGGFLELVFIEFGLILAGLAAAALVGGWASDETSGRLEMLLATPLARVRWLASGAVGILAGIAIIVVVTAAGIAIGTLSAGGEIATPVIGTLAIGLYAMALAGVGLAVGGLIGAEYAGPAVAALTIVTWLLDLVAGDLGLPAWVTQLALSSHMGQPMVGVWDGVGIVACLVLAVGGLGLGAWGMRCRDLTH
jgi:ABC-2 type transport system permease protein